MKAPRVCVAGVDETTGAHVRPTTAASHPITRQFLRIEGGPFEVGGVVDLGDVTPEGSPPETEDHAFTPENARSIRMLDADEYLQVLDGVCHHSLEAAFGPELERREWKYAVEGGAGLTSLAVVRAARRPSLSIDNYGKLQMRFNDPGRPAYLSVTDVRFFEADHSTIRSAVLQDVERRLQRRVPVFLMFGLARAFVATGDDRERHWLQLNGLCLEDRPTGSLP